MLYLKDLVVSGRHGVHPHEKQDPQPFRISVELDIDSTPAAISDDLADTLDWSWLHDTIVSVVQDNSFNLVERLAQAVAEAILVDKRVQRVTVSVDKLEAFASGIPGVRITVAQPA